MPRAQAVEGPETNSYALLRHFLCPNISKCELISNKAPNWRYFRAFPAFPQDHLPSPAHRSKDPAMSWKITFYAPRAVVQAALIAHEDMFDWDPDIVIAGSEIAEDKPEDWQLEAWLANEPDDDARRAHCPVRDRSGTCAPAMIEEELEDQDWVTLSQQGVEPIHEGPFYVHTPNTRTATIRACATS
jgi:hypothetical protein